MKKKQTILCGLITIMFSLVFSVLSLTACDNDDDDNGGEINPGGATITSATGIVLVRVAGGSFQMGQNGDGSTGNITPIHTVTLSSFYIGKYEVTQKQWQDVMGRTQQQQQALATTSTTNLGRSDDRPIYWVKWYETLVFCNKLSIAEGLTPAYRISDSTDPADWGTVPTNSDTAWNAATVEIGSTGYRLPTEAQWEYAAKGGDPTAAGWVGYTYAGSDTVGDVAWYSSNSGNKTHEVGKKAPNGLGLYDMSGNVWEWCWDWYGSYQSGAQTDPVGASSGTNRVSRGGRWNSSAEDVRSAYRNDYNPYYRNSNIGFRLLCP